MSSQDSTGSDTRALYSLPVESCELTLYIKIAILTRVCRRSVSGRSQGWDSVVHIFDLIARISTITFTTMHSHPFAIRLGKQGMELHYLYGLGNRFLTGPVPVRMENRAILKRANI